MTSSPELFRVFQIEANEYLDALDRLIADGETALDASAFVAAARAMRGSATMARASRISELAFAFEQIGNAVREGELTWSVALHEELRDTASDIRVLVSTASQPSPDDQRRGAQRLAELRRFMPNDAPRPNTPVPSASTAPIFIALQTAAIAADLDAFVADSRSRGLLDDVISRVRSLRGIAGVADLPPLGDVADSIERSLRALAPDALLTETDADLLRAAAALLRRASGDLRARGRINLASGEIARFARASAAPSAVPAEPQRVVRIDDLFYADAGPHVVARGTTAESVESRFRTEVVGRGEHLRRLIADARQAIDPISRERASRDLRLHLERLESFARSFNASGVAAFFGDAARYPGALEPHHLDAINAGAGALLVRYASVSDLERQLATLPSPRRATPPPAPAPVPRPPATPIQPAPPSTSGKPPAPAGTSGRALHALLESGLAALRPLEDQPLSAPAPVDDDRVVPVESLLYRGQAALQRAVEVRNAMRARGGVDDESLQELYDLLDLARAE